MPEQRPVHLSSVFVLFFISGATALAYQVVWARMLVRTFGATSFAVSTVLAAYMAGLALGSYIFGKFIDRRGNPVLTYGFLELGIAVFALLFPTVIAALNPLYRGLYASLGGKFYTLSIVRFAISFALLLVPTTCLGGTLPVLSRYVTRSLSNLTARVGLLYSLNTFGAVIGAFGTGFLLLPSLGIRMTTYVAVCANLAIFVISLWLSRTSGEMVRVSLAPKDHVVPTRIASADRIVLAAFLLTGVAALSAEVIWTRVLTLVVGTTVYAFSIMLTVFLLGLALGSAVFARIGQRVSNPHLVFALLVLAIGISVFLSTAAFAALPTMYMKAYESLDRTWSNVVLMELLISLAIMIVPTFLMGGTFPLVARIYATDISKVGGRIGTAYAFNTVGAILGSFAGGFVLLKLLGVEGGMLVVSSIYIGAGTVLLTTAVRRISQGWRLTVLSGVGAAVVLMLVLSPGWDEKVMTTAVYVYAPIYDTAERMMERARTSEILYYDDSPGATVSVELQDNLLSLKIDGKVDASTGHDMRTQEMISHLPILFHPDPETVLVIGLGSGVSVSSAGAHDVTHIDCVELLDNVVEAATFFREYNNDILSDPRVNLILGDGRNHLALTDKSYDVIISEPTNPWISGVGDLFTREYFEAAARRLKPGGVMSAWLQIYHISNQEFRTTLKTFASVFPHVTLWFSNEPDMIMLGSMSPVTIDQRVVERMGQPTVRRDLERVLVDEPSDVLSMLLLDEEKVRSYVQGSTKINTDDNMLLEFGGGRQTNKSTIHTNLSSLVKELAPHHFPGLDEALNRRVKRQVIARGLVMSASIKASKGDVAGAIDLYDGAYSYAPHDPYVALERAEAHLRIGKELLQNGDCETAAYHFRNACSDTRFRDSWVAFHGLGVCSYLRSDYENARRNLEAGLDLNPYNSAGHVYLAMTLVAQGDKIGAIRHYERAVELRPWASRISGALARLYASTETNLDRALELARSAVASEPSVEHYDTLGWVHFEKGDFADAERALGQALKQDPEAPSPVYHLALVYNAEGEKDKAKSLLIRVLSLDPSGEYAPSARELLEAIGN